MGKRRKKVSHKHKKKRRKFSFDADTISKTDLDELNLLYIQLNVVMVLIYSDLMYYFAVIAAYNEITNKNENKKDGFEGDKLMVSFSMSGLWVYIYITLINLTRYHNLRIRKAAGEVRFSLVPNLFLIVGGLLEVVVYSYFYRGSKEFLKRDIDGFSFINENDIDEVIGLLSIQKNTMIVRFYADYFFFRTTIEGIIVVMSRYNTQLKESGIPNPDISALNAQFLYTISRVIIAKATVKHLIIVSNNINKNFRYNEFMAGEVSVVYGNYYGIISNIFLFIGFYKIYERNIIQPIFGG